MLAPSASPARSAAFGLRFMAAGLIAIQLLSPGCTTTRRQPVDASIPRPPAVSAKPPAKPKAVRISGYYADGVLHSYKGEVRAQGPDSLAFSPLQSEGLSEWWGGPPAREQPFVVARSEVDSLGVSRVDETKTVLAVLLVAGIIAGVTVAIVSASMDDFMQ